MGGEVLPEYVAKPTYGGDIKELDAMQYTIKSDETWRLSAEKSPAQVSSKGQKMIGKIKPKRSPLGKGMKLVKCKISKKEKSRDSEA